jgi:hypothetical protein
MHKITLRLTREELDYVMLRAKRELSDPATWIRRTAVSIADGRAKVSVNVDHPAFAMWPRP